MILGPAFLDDIIGATPNFICYLYKLPRDILLPPAPRGTVHTASECYAKYCIEFFNNCNGLSDIEKIVYGLENYVD